MYFYQKENRFLCSPKPLAAEVAGESWRPAGADYRETTAEAAIEGVAEDTGSVLTFLVEGPPARSKAAYVAHHPCLVFGAREGAYWLDEGRMDRMFRNAARELRLSEELGEAQFKVFKLLCGSGRVRCVNTRWPGYQALLGARGEDAGTERRSAAVYGGLGAGGKKRINLLALGDVGSTVLMGLKLLGGDVLSEIGICDMNPQTCRRFEYEMNQTAYAWDYDRLPPVKIVTMEELFDCDAFVFCASKGVPPVRPASVDGPAAEDLPVDVRMVQLEANREIVGQYARLAREKKFRGLFAVVSDPVDPLCRAAFLASNRGTDGSFDGQGLRPEQIQGYGLGVMNARAAYYAKKDRRFRSFLTEGRAFGPHGQDLVIANSITHYDDPLSGELTKLAVEANLRTRETGFKPYVAPALSSAAISILQTLAGDWHYSSNFLGGVYLGSKNRTSFAGLEIEMLPLPEDLYRRIKQAYLNLEAME